MSLENDQTVEVYMRLASLYIQNSLNKYNENTVAALEKEKHLHRFLNSAFSTLPKNAPIFEIGSGAGENANFLSKRGFTVTASDVATAFIEETRSKKIQTISFNVLKDEYCQKYYGILCWRVFVHFTLEDAKYVLTKSYDALETNGRFVFNAMNIENHKKSSEWVDFSGIYHMGAERFYQYYRKSELDKIINEIGYQTVGFSYESNDNHKWLVYVLEKV